MANELVEKKENKVAVIEGHELGEIIKPLIKEIHLFDSYIAGTTHLEDKSVLDEIKAGDMLTLQREENKFDLNAILVLYEDGRKIGYVPEKDNIIFARLMDAGKLLKAKIIQITQKGTFKQISVGIYLVDF
ncbi:MAG: HIRAN domain-containing protein [Lachnospiraceae bacterium]|nr:HIRAN domain-containing protein [Lachnospiraceae bacterium]